MNEFCRKLQNQISEQGVESALSSSEASAHLAQCDECRTFAETLASIDSIIEALPEYDAPDEVVVSLIKQVRKNPLVGKKRSWGRRFLWSFISGTAVLFLLEAVFSSAFGIPGIALSQAGLTVVLIAMLPPLIGWKRFGLLALAAAALGVAAASIRSILTFLFGFIEGAAGALLMLLCLACGVVFALNLIPRKHLSQRRRFAGAAAFVTAAIALFMLRATTSLFFGTNFEAPESFTRTNQALRAGAGTEFLTPGYDDTPVRGVFAPLIDLESAKRAVDKVLPQKVERSFSQTSQALRQGGGAPESTHGYNDERLSDSLSLYKRKEAGSRRDRDGAKDDYAVGSAVEAPQAASKPFVEKELNAPPEEAQYMPLPGSAQNFRNDKAGDKALAAKSAPLPTPEALVMNERREDKWMKGEEEPGTPLNKLQQEAPADIRDISGLDSKSARTLRQELPARELGGTGSYQRQQTRIPTSADDQTSFAAFLKQRDELNGLSYLDPHGYWSNTYIPGDSAFRMLAERLAQYSSQPVKPHLLATEEQQPFDPPKDSALALYLNSDKQKIEGPTRLLLQVGLQGANRRNGLRTAVNVAFLVYLPEPAEPSEISTLESLLLAFLDKREVGDRFSLVSAGSASQVIPWKEFRYGSLKVYLDSLRKQKDEAAPSLSLDNAVSEALGQLGAVNDPGSPLGTSTVVVITPSTLRSELSLLESSARSSAVAGIPFSVVGIGRRIDSGQLGAIALAGQGERFTLADGSRADEVAFKELNAASRVVARALRLNIRLGEGVKLIQVIGSQRLDEQRSEQVRQSEKSIDQRLSKSLGIESDRGEDEDGIQIFIPAFYANDSHTILLDVAAEKPGKLLEASVKYKDLLALKNETLRSSFALNQLSQAGLNGKVFADLIARELSSSLLEASTLLAQGNRGAGKALIDGRIAFLNQACAAIPSLRRDRSIAADISMLTQFSQTIAAGNNFQYISDSLDYAAKRKLSKPQLDFEVLSETKQ